MVRFHETLSERSVYFRYFHPIRLNARVAHERLTRMCFIDYSREMALVVVRMDREARREDLLGVGRLIRVHGTRDAEFAILISDQWQGQGIGTELLARLVQIGREEKLERIVADILTDNTEMQLGQEFVKTWLVKNNGSCTWGAGYKLIFSSGEKLSGVAQPFNAVVAPGQEVEVSVNFKAPTQAGQYVSSWQMANANGTPFPRTFYVKIVVK